MIEIQKYEEELSASGVLSAVSAAKLLAEVAKQNAGITVIGQQIAQLGERTVCSAGVCEPEQAKVQKLCQDMAALLQATLRVSQSKAVQAKRMQQRCEAAMAQLRFNRQFGKPWQRQK